MESHFHDMPYKIETNQFGQVLMRPFFVRHAFRLGQIQSLLQELRPDGKTAPQCPVQTAEGTKVADVVWVSPERWELIKHEPHATLAPELCVELMFQDDQAEELEEKSILYLEAEAQEVWVCDPQGNFTFYNNQGELASSNLFPKFPERIPLKQ